MSKRQEPMEAKMRSGLLLPDKVLEEYVDPATMVPFKGVPVILVTSIDVDTTTAEGEKLWYAALTAAEATKKAGIPQLVALRSDYPDAHADLMNLSGAYVVFIDRNPAAPAQPYYTLAQLVEKYCGQHTVMIMTTPGQNIAANPANIDALLDATQRFEIVTGVRDYETYMDLSRSRRLVDSIIAQAISDLAGVPFDTMSGILALTAKGRETLLKLGEPSMRFTTTIARWARQWKVPNGGAMLRFAPSVEIATLEDASSMFLAAHCGEALQLLEHVGKLCSTSGLSGLSERQRHAYQTAMMALDVLSSYKGTHT